MITLLSDWKLRDPYLGIFKGQLMKLMPNESIIDITHHLETYNHSQTAFIAKNCYSHFPENSLHIILSGISGLLEVKPVLIAHNGHFFLGEDCGIFSMMFGKNNINAYQYNGDMSLPETEKLALMASWVIQKSYLKNTIPYLSLKFKISQLSEPYYNTEQKTISGKVSYIDSNYNAVTNIPVSMFETIGKHKEFIATVLTAHPIEIKRCHSFYNPKELEIFLVYNSLGFIEITLFNGNIAALANIQTGTDVEIKFF